MPLATPSYFDRAMLLTHSSGYAFVADIAQAIIDKDILATNNKLGGFYILAPENACATDINDIIAKTDIVWQYGTEEIGSTNPHEPTQQDGIAPQCAIPGLEFNSPNQNRGRIRFGGSDDLLGFKESHFSTSYKWVLDFIENEDGYVIERD